MNPSNVSPPPSPPPEAPAIHSNLEADRLEQLLPQIHELARKVGGYHKLAELVRQLDRGDGS
jgi:hypothetical protein